MEFSGCLVMLISSSLLGIVTTQYVPPTAYWCTINDLEFKKCQDLTSAIVDHIQLGRNTTVGAYTYRYSDVPALTCIAGNDRYDCMQKIFNGEADLMQVETGLSYTAGEYYNMIPLAAEKYQPGDNDNGLSFFAVAVARKDNPSVNINNLKGKAACLPGVGQAAGWVYPMSTLFEKQLMDIVECNVPVKSADAFFGGLCAPDALQRYYNPFGNNPASVCQRCVGKSTAYCTCNDPYADYFGAFKCMALGAGDVTFVRETTVDHYIQFGNTTDTANDFELLCTDGTRAPVDQFSKCNWGQISSHIVMTSLVRSLDLRGQYKILLQMLSIDFGVNGKSNDLFQLFQSFPQYGQPNLMFTDQTVMLKDTTQVAGGSRDSYYSWAGPEMRRRSFLLNSCPIQQARWCVISHYEMMKCENMIMAFSAKKIKPDLNCIMGSTVQDCMDKIRTGDADLVTLDAADVYQAGMQYGLVPIAYEDYSGDNVPSYYVVAVARRANTYLTLFNMKQRRTCHPSVMSAAGWIIPVDVLVQTGQIRILDCDAYHAFGQYFSKSCVPGILSSYYNPYGTNPVNLCEACQTSGPKRCLRNDDELYYGASGAFRCVTEKGGDVGFIRHTTVRENTDGRNQADWARNRRSDDYELLCNDGTRKDIDDWADCNLATVPNNAIVTAGFQSQRNRDVFWTLLNFAQQFFDADDNPDFPMFDSYINHKDLIFQDATVRLMPIDPENQTYANYLGPDFVRRMQNMQSEDCVTGSPAMSSSPLSVVLLVLSVVVVFTLNYCK